MPSPYRGSPTMSYSGKSLVAVIAMTSNEKEISHGRVSWQARRGCIGMGPLASSSG